MASRKFSLTLVCLTAAAVMIAGCGSDSSNPAAPADMAPPALPSGLNIEVAPRHEAVTVSWEPNVTDPDLVGYLIYRSSYDLDPVPLVTMPQAATTYHDTDLDGVGRLLTYHVRAVDVRNNTSAAATITVNLDEEPVEPVRPSPAHD